MLRWGSVPPVAPPRERRVGEAPDVHAEAVGDGVCSDIDIDSDSVLEGYRQRRRDVPDAWLRKAELGRGWGTKAKGEPLAGGSRWAVPLGPGEAS